MAFLDAFQWTKGRK